VISERVRQAADETVHAGEAVFRLLPVSLEFRVELINFVGEVSMRMFVSVNRSSTLASCSSTLPNRSSIRSKPSLTIRANFSISVSSVLGAFSMPLVYAQFLRAQYADGQKEIVQTAGRVQRR
jgi:hypothetical protein